MWGEVWRGEVPSLGKEGRVVVRKYGAYGTYGTIIKGLPESGSPFMFSPPSDGRGRGWVYLFYRLQSSCVLRT